MNAPHLDELRTAIDGDRRRLCAALGLRADNGRFFCPACQSDGHPHADGDFSVEAGFKCHRCGWSGDGLGLVRLVKSCDFPAAVVFARDVYGIRGDDLGHGVKRTMLEPNPTATPAKTKKTHPTIDGAVKAAAWKAEKVTGHKWTERRRDVYRDAEGRDLAVQIRFDRADGATDAQGKPVKTFRPVHAVADGWQTGDPQGKWPLFRLPELLASAGTVYMNEGEKKSCAGAEIGLTCTAWPHGADGIGKADFSPLAGRDVILLPDNDAPGRKSMKKVAALLVALSPPARVRIVELPGLPPKGDLADFIALRTGQTPEVIRHEVERVAASAPELAPPRVGPIIAETTAPRTQDAAHPTKSKPTEAFYYDKHRKEYLLRNQRGCWLSLTETQFKKELAVRGYRTSRAEGEDVSPADLFIIRLRDTRDVDYVGSLAGHSAGFYETNGHRVLVTDSPQIMAPVAGDWYTLHAMLSGLLLDGEHDQRPYLYGWLKVGYEALRAGQRRPGQALALAGPHECGKSLIQQIITLIFGGRSAKPYAYMTEATAFNADLFEAEHLCIEDEPASTDIRTRRAFGAQIKQVTACDTQRCHAKHRQAITLSPFWRLTISLNDEAENLMVLPPIDDSMEDKLLILRAVKSAMPMPTATQAERVAFWQHLVAEVPAFLDFLCHWQIPAELLSDRYGIRHFHHPDLLREIDALSPESRLKTILDKELFSNPTAMTWTGTAEDLEMRLTSEGSYQYEARRLLNWTNAAGTYLGRLAKKYPARFNQERSSQRRIWAILPPKGG